MDAKTKEELLELQKLLNTQDNRITADPLFIVYQKRHVWAHDNSGESEDYVWYDRDNSDTVEPEGRTDEEMQKAGYEQCYYVEVDSFVTAHFTEKAAQLHIDTNGHNLNKPRIYVTHQHRSWEWNTVREFLMKDIGHYLELEQMVRTHFKYTHKRLVTGQDCDCGICSKLAEFEGVMV